MAITPGMTAGGKAAPSSTGITKEEICALPDPIMRQLKSRAARGQLNALAADRAVWMRMAA